MTIWLVEQMLRFTSAFYPDWQPDVAPSRSLTIRTATPSQDQRTVDRNAYGMRFSF